MRPPSASRKKLGGLKVRLISHLQAHFLQVGNAAVGIGVSVTAPLSPWPIAPQPTLGWKQILNEIANGTKLSDVKFFD
jgi:hypothetical protein